jgi:RNA polymerase sigma-70 factor, ECF subfamily
MFSSDRDEFLKLLGPVHDRLSRFVVSTTRDAFEAEDLLSETVLVAFERFHTLRDRKAFVSFLFTIATRIHRQQYRRRREDLYDPELAEAIPSQAASPEQAAEIRLVREALALLPEKQRETVVLFEVSGFTLEEIREIQGGTLSGVKSRLRRGREQLAKLLGVSATKSEHSNHLYLSRSRARRLAFSHE